MPRPRTRRARSINRIAGHPALDFVNTIDPDNPAPEHLPDYEALLGWCEAAGIVRSDAIRKLRADAKLDPAHAAHWLNEAHALRRIASRLYLARVKTEPAAARVLASFNHLLRRFTATSTLVRAGLGYGLTALGTEEPFSRPIVRLVQLTAELLTSPSFDHLRMCQADGCEWFFIDDSRGHNRRWCSMEICGNREKARRRYRSVKAGLDSGE